MPAQTPHGDAVTICPRIERRTWRTSPLATAHVAACRVGPGLAAGAVAARAADREADVDGVRRAERGFDERRARRRPPRRDPAPGPLGPRRVPKGSPPKNASKRSPNPNASRRAPSRGAAAAVVAEHVVAPAALGIAQRLVRDADLLEPLLGRRVAGVAVGVVRGARASRYARLISSSVAERRDAEHLVVVAAHERCRPSCCETADDGRERVAVVHARRAEHADDARRAGRRSRRARRTIEQSRSSSSRFSEPMLTVEAAVEELADERHDDDLVLEHLEQPRRAARRSANASCSAARRLTPPTYSGSSCSGVRRLDERVARGGHDASTSASPVGVTSGSVAHGAARAAARRAPRPRRRDARSSASSLEVRRPAARPRRSRAPRRAARPEAGAARAGRCARARCRAAARRPSPRAG